jgi:hypothetical protein
MVCNMHVMVRLDDYPEVAINWLPLPDRYRDDANPESKEFWVKNAFRQSQRRREYSRQMETLKRAWRRWRRNIPGRGSRHSQVKHTAIEGECDTTESYKKQAKAFIRNS